MKVVAMFFALMAAGAYSQQAFMQTGGEPMEAVENVKKVPVVGSQFKTKGDDGHAMRHQPHHSIHDCVHGSCHLSHGS